VNQFPQLSAPQVAAVGSALSSTARQKGIMGKRSKLMKPDFEKDVVYLVQFPRAASVPSLSPFVLKLETWLRMADIRYQVCILTF